MDQMLRYTNMYKIKGLGYVAWVSSSVRSGRKVEGLQLDSFRIVSSLVPKGPWMSMVLSCAWFRCQVPSGIMVRTSKVVRFRLNALTDNG